jgi:PadR family transcriptional regulator, regulatory protein PadR
MARRQTEIMKGTLDLLVLKTLALEPRHGVGVADRIEQITRGTFQVKPGSLFPALHRLEQEGFIAGEWGETPEGRRAKYYRITAAGQRQLAAEKKNWARVALAIAQILEAD